MLAWAALLAGLTLPTTTPEIANVATLIMMGTGLLLLALVPVYAVGQLGRGETT